MAETVASRSETTPASKERTLQLRLRPSADLRSWCHVWVRLCDDAAAVDKDALALEAEASALREVTEKLQGHGITAILPLVPDKEFKAQSFGRSYTYLDGFTYPYGASDSTPPSLAESTWYNHLWSAAKPASGVEKSMMPVRNVLELAELDEANVVSPPTNAAYQEAWRNLREAADFLDIHLQVQGKVLVHCNLGVNRTVAVVTAFLVRHCGIPLEDAARQVCV